VDHSWTASTAEGQRIYSALSQGLKSWDFNIGLSITVTNGYGPIELNTSNGEFAGGDGHPITLNGQVYSTGLGVHANSEIHIQATNLQTPACTRFQADVGLDDEVGSNGSVVFQVFADGVKLFDSGVMTGASATQHIDVGIGNKSDLRFVVTDAGNNSFYDHADWAGATLSCSTPPSAISGSLDPSFDGDGIVITRFDEPNNVSNSASGFVQLPDGRLVIAGTRFGGGADDATLLARYNLDGSLDPTFGNGGKSVTNLKPKTASDINASEETVGLTLLPDGKLLVGSVSGGVRVRVPMISRFTPNGVLDPTFGSNGKIEVTDFINGSVGDIILLPDNGFLVNEYRGVQRYSANGILDTSFGNAGTIERSDPSSAGVSAIARQSDGRVLVLTADGYLRRYTADGQLDTGFGTGGTIGYQAIRSSYPSSSPSDQSFTGTALVLLPGDRFLVGLQGLHLYYHPSGPPSSDVDSFLVRQNADGSVDPSFGQGGQVVYTDGYNLSNLRLLPDGKLLSYPFRFNSDGSLDRTYTYLPATVGNVFFRGVQADGKILLGGETLRNIGPTYDAPTDFLYVRVFP